MNNEQIAAAMTADDRIVAHTLAAAIAPVAEKFGAAATAQILRRIADTLVADTISAVKTH